MNDELKAYLIGFDPDYPNYTWRDARGVFDWKPGDEPAEVAIARARSFIHSLDPHHHDDHAEEAE
jgi:hypothetical protein